MNTRFRRRNALAVHDLHFGPNMTPMVDVVMVILVFFMTSTAILGPEWLLRVQTAPAPGTSQPGAAPPPDRVELPPPRFVVRLDRAGGATVIEGIGLARAALDQLGPRLSALAGELADQAASAQLVIAPGPDVPYQDVVFAYDLAQLAGFVKVSLAEPAPAPGVDLPR